MVSVRCWCWEFPSERRVSSILMSAIAVSGTVLSSMSRMVEAKSSEDRMSGVIKEWWCAVEWEPPSLFACIAWDESPRRD